MAETLARSYVSLGNAEAQTVGIPVRIIALMFQSEHFVHAIVSVLENTYNCF